MRGFGTQLKRARKTEALSIRELAREAGVDASWISRLESGERSNISFAAARRLADVLHISLDVLANRPRKYWTSDHEHMPYEALGTVHAETTTDADLYFGPDGTCLCMIGTPCLLGKLEWPRQCTLQEWTAWRRQHEHDMRKGEL